jgi:glycosyltransferase involved in cell wall biosynthesis
LNHDVQFISYKRQYPKFIFPGKTDKDPSKKTIQVDDVEYIIDSINPYTWYQAIKKIIRFNPKKVILPWWVIFWAPQTLYFTKKIKEKNIKTIIICHNVSEHENNRIKEKINRHVLCNGDILITQSSDESKKLLKIVGDNSKEDHVITGFHPTYVDLCFDSRPQAKGENCCPTLLFFGFVRKYKGLDVLLEALPLVLRKRRVRLMIVGEFWKDKQRYVNKISELELEDHITIIDAYVPNEQLGKYFHAADLVVQPYLSASGSGVSQLAYGFGKPVIATNVGSIAEVIVDGVNGRLVHPGNPGELAQAVVEALEAEKLKSMTMEAAKVKERFSWNRFAEMVASC